MHPFDALSLPWLVMVAPLIGSLLGVLVVRLPARRPVVWGRSVCDTCGSKLRPLELVPLVSYLWLRGACHHCGKPISPMHPAIEFAALGIAVWAALADPWHPLLSCLLGWTLLTLAWIDSTDLLLPDVLTLPLLVAGLGFTWLYEPGLLLDRSVAAIGAYSLFEAAAIAYRNLRGREGLGGGDAKLIAVAGAWCGIAALPLIILGAALFGLCLGLALAVLRREITWATRIPFGPCIALAFWMEWLYCPGPFDPWR